MKIGVFIEFSFGVLFSAISVDQKLINKIYIILLLFQNLMCCASDVLEGRGLVQVSITVCELIKFSTGTTPVHSVKSPTRYNNFNNNNESYVSKSSSSSPLSSTSPSSPLI